MCDVALSYKARCRKYIYYTCVGVFAGACRAKDSRVMCCYVCSSQLMVHSSNTRKLASVLVRSLYLVTSYWAIVTILSYDYSTCCNTVNRIAGLFHKLTSESDSCTFKVRTFVWKTWANSHLYCPCEVHCTRSIYLSERFAFSFKNKLLGMCYMRT